MGSTEIAGSNYREAKTHAVKVSHISDQKGTSDPLKC
jgi:hypothetical protein